MILKRKYSDDELIAILVEFHIETTGKQPVREELTKISNAVNHNTRPHKEDELQTLRSYFYQNNSRWPSTIEYENLIRYYYDKTNKG